MIPRSRFAALVLALSALAAAGPALTTIQDVLYKADGTRFSGSLTISWNSFQAADNSTIVTQSTTVKVVDGVIRVQLAPTTTANPQVNYSVTYTSDGKVQFQETWNVPSSGQPLRIRDVRVASAATAPSTTGAAGDTGSSPVAESSIVGLIADLGARPLKGAGFAAGRTAVVDPTGMLSSATGADSDCVHVDGSAGPCGSSVDLSFVDSEALTGIVDGANNLFGLSAVPDPAASLAVYLNGILQKVNQDFTLTGSTIQFVAAAVPQPGDTLLASYRTSGADAGGAISTAPQVLCSGSGAGTSSQTLTNIGTCDIPAGTLQPGDRVEVRFDAAHTGAAAGFSVEVDWGATVLLHRDAAASDVLVTGRGDAGIQAAGAQLSTQSWGTVLPFAATVSTARDSDSGGLTIFFQGLTLNPADTVALTNFTVLRIP